MPFESPFFLPPNFDRLLEAPDSPPPTIEDDTPLPETSPPSSPPGSPSYSPSDVELERYDHTFRCTEPFARCRCTTIPHELLAEYEPNTSTWTVYRSLSASQAWDQMDAVTIGATFMPLFSDAEMNRHVSLLGVEGVVVSEFEIPRCPDCLEVSRVQRFHQQSTTNVVAELWTMSDTTYDNTLQWLPREMLEDVWELVTQTNEEIGYQGSHTFSSAAYEFDYLAGGLQEQFINVFG